jgi:FAD:protein FMN transferase
VADAYATALHAMGPVRGRRFAAELARTGPYESMLVTPDGQETVTPGFLDHSGTRARLAG